MFYLFLTSYSAILISELVGDKSLYTISSLATRFRFLPVFCGFTGAFMMKMLIAVMLGSVITKLPSVFVAIVSTATFFLTAVVIWFKKSEAGPVPRKDFFSKAMLITFAAIFFSEWADLGQIMAATLTARYGLPVVIWTGATLALVTKGLLALVLGYGLRKYIPVSVLRIVSVAVCVTLGILSAVSLGR
jgi:putative Ca2+/H+ antiporter (TMEM165/GDT1 family)